MGAEVVTMRWVAIAAGVLLVAPGAVGGVDDETWNEAVSFFNEDFKRSSIGFKKRGIDALPITDERTIHFIIRDKELLAHEDWRVRAAAAERLARVAVPELRPLLQHYASVGPAASRGRLDRLAEIR